MTISPANSADSKTQHNNLLFLIFYVLVWEETGVNILLMSFDSQLCFIIFLYYLHSNPVYISVIEIVF